MSKEKFKQLFDRLDVLIKRKDRLLRLRTCFGVDEEFRASLLLIKTERKIRIITKLLTQ